MRNFEVIKQFLGKCSAKSYSGNLISTGEKLISYNTCIAEWNKNNLMVNVTKYSSSTSKIQNMLLDSTGTLQVAGIINVPINTQSLWRHKERT
jgi:hypothetical protein